MVVYPLIVSEGRGRIGRGAGDLEVVYLLPLLLYVEAQALVVLRELLEVVGALRGLLEVVEVRRFELLLQLLDLCI